LEINQTCAVQTGCFAGDTPGFPVTISTSGTSYRLTAPLIVLNENISGIQISTDNVSIDLAGFEIRGPVVCSGTPIVCAPNSGTGSGVLVTPDTLSGISVRNGSIRGMGSRGVSLGVQSEVANLRVRSNRVDGINVSAGSTVSGNTALQNGGGGIFASTGSTVSGNTVLVNGGDGISVFDGSTVSGNTVYQNAGDGIETTIGCNVAGNTVRGNGGWGLLLGSLSGFHGNVSTQNALGNVTGGWNAGNNTCNSPQLVNCD
jgi:parallel beta-helix repeat protein